MAEGDRLWQLYIVWPDHLRRLDGPTDLGVKMEKKFWSYQGKILRDHFLE